MNSVTASATSGVQILEQWAKEQDKWLQNLVGAVSSRRAPLFLEELQILYQRFLEEKQLSEDHPVEDSFAGLSVSSAMADKGLLVVSLSDVEGVNRLKEKQTIEMNPCLTVLFGENGAGKSGYVRIFKKAASTRGAEDIIPDVFRPNPPLTPHAVVKFKDGGEDVTVDWKGEEGVSPFTRIAVFDPHCFQFHIDPEQTFSYVPQDLSLFKWVHDGIEGVRKLLSQEAERRKPAPSPFLQGYNRGTSVYVELETLGESTEISKLQTLAAKTDDTTLATYRERVAALKSGQVEAQLKLSREDEASWKKFEEGINIFLGNDWDKLAQLSQSVKQKQQTFLDASKGAFEGEDIKGVLGKTWSAFIEAAENYINGELKDDYPGATDQCIYCRQDLDEKALALVEKYRKFCNDQLRKDFDTAKTNYCVSATTLTDVDLVAARNEYTRLANANKESEKKDPLLDEVAACLDVIEAIQKNVKAYEPVLADDRKLISRGLLDKVITRRQSLTDSVTTLSGKAEEREKELTAGTKELHQLEDKNRLAAQLDTVIEHVQSAKWISRAKAHDKGFTKILTSLTVAAKTASESLINQNFEKAFRDESDALRCPSVKLDFPGKKGTPARRKTISELYQLSDILSEGEQKVIALADFLAEVSIRESNAPIIFDDPINSLDYKRLCYVADRMAALSKMRQVIVFTHNIWFAIELLQRFEKQRTDCSYYEISESETAKGIVTKGIHPRTDTWNDRKKRINQIIADIKKSSGEMQQALIDRAYSLMRGACEVLVEGHVLAGVVRRFEPNVRMTTLPDINSQKIELAKKEILPLFEKCSRITQAHSQPLETLNVRPSVQDVSADWETLQSVESQLRDGS